ncbi:MAG: ATP synthase F1 subunit gamma [Chloroflexi bacterium]|nr:ATP synthase F1 subunit gamma [Chloroflexota bacterium]MBV9892908.1 ATP synthase F1 subunit gamma [Chloroflexota bacterium]
MPSLRDIRRRIRAIRNTAKITKAMEMVAASRLRRAQMRVTAARPYADAMRTLMAELGGIAPGGGEALHPLLVQRDVRNVGVLIVTPDRGLAGALNTNVIRRGTEVILQNERSDGQTVQVVTVGRKGQDFLARRGRNLLGTFTGIIDRVRYDDVIPIARVIMDSFVNGQIDRALLVYPRFISTLSQRPEVVQLLPIERPQTEERSADRRLDYIFEPDPQSILEQLLPRYIEVQIYQAILETAASFFSAQMVAMRNATENANDLVSSLSLTYNKVRQANITREVTEIASAAEAMAASSRR